MTLSHPSSRLQVDQMQSIGFLEERLQEADAMVLAGGQPRFQRVEAVSALAPLTLGPLKVQACVLRHWGA